MAKTDQTKYEIEPEIEEFLSLLVSIAARVLTKDRAERKNDPGKSDEVENESSSIHKS